VTQLPLALDVLPESFTGKVAQYFTDRPGRWIDGRELAKVGGAYAWRSRVSECRTALGMVIENRLRRERTASGERFTVSEYRWLGQ
jgi:hypothetical protein